MAIRARRQGAGPDRGHHRGPGRTPSGAARATTCPTSTSARPGSTRRTPRSAAPSPWRTELLGFPRHLSQHVGGYVLTKRRLDETVPIGNAAMKDRTFIEWDKDDIDALGLMKVDVLALGMLTALKKSVRHAAADRTATPITDIAHIPQEEPGVYDMLCKADSVGVFQVESRAQMSMLPRLKPQQVLRPGDRGGDRAARPDPGRHGPSLPEAARGASSRSTYPRPRRTIRQGRAGGDPRQDHGRAALPGAGHARGHRGGQVHRRRGRRPARGPWPPSATSATVGELRRQVRRGHDVAAATTREFADAVLQADRGLRLVRLPGEPRDQLRASWSTPRPG